AGEPPGHLDVAGRARLDEAPGPVAEEEPAEAGGGLVEQPLLPRVARAVDLDGASEVADSRVGRAADGPGLAERDAQLGPVVGQRLQRDEGSLADVEERPAVGAAHALRLVGGAELERAVAVGAGDARRRDLRDRPFGGGAAGEAAVG